jgi:hypothetical protein
MTDLQPLADYREIIGELTELYRATDPTFTVDEQQQIQQKMNQLIDQFVSLHDKLAGYSPSTATYDYEGDAIMTSATSTATEMNGKNSTSRNTGTSRRPYLTIDSRNADNYSRVIELERILQSSDAIKSVVNYRTILTSSQPSESIEYPYEHQREQQPTAPGGGNELSALLYLRNRAWMRTFTTNVTTPDGLLFSELSDEMRELWAAYAKGRSQNREGGTAKSESDVGADDGVDGPYSIPALDALFSPLMVIDFSPSELVLLVQTARVVEYFQQLISEQVRATYRRLQASERQVQTEQLRHRQLLQALEEREEQRRALAAFLDKTREERTAERMQQLQAVHREELELAKELSKADNQFKSQVWPEQQQLNSSTETSRQRRQRIRQEYFYSPTYRSFLVATYLVREKAFLEHLSSVLENRRNNRRQQGRMRNPGLFTSLSGFDPHFNLEIKGYLRRRSEALQKIYDTEYTRAANKV